MFGVCFSSEFLSVNAILNLDFEYDRKASGDGTFMQHLAMCIHLLTCPSYYLRILLTLPGIVILIPRVIAKLLYFLFL